MSRGIGTLAVALVTTLVLGAGSVLAATKVTITREMNEPESVEVKAGDEIEWVNASGGTVHIWFGGDDAVRFYVGGRGMGKGSSVTKFEKPGTYDYTVHVTGVKSHTHTGRIIVK
jgi:plastocyanin